ncbi:MAG: STAS domain-containing protein [Hyphomonadaceae bacterium]|nr:STAS domain-containing protein [Hyphomonadaceae bacterium]
MTDLPDVVSSISLDPVLDLRAAAPLRDALLERRGGPVIVDATRVEQLGGLCLQVLLSARNAWENDGAAFSIAARSSAFEAALTAFGASGAFGAAQLAE